MGVKQQQYEILSGFSAAAAAAASESLNVDESPLNCWQEEKKKRRDGWVGKKRYSV